jgi:DNA modification methylase
VNVILEYFQIKHNSIICGDAAQVLKTFPDKYIDLTVTSPPYDDLRTYKGYSFDFDEIVRELYRVTKEGGVVVWVVGDSTVEGNETGTSFRQALRFKEIGFNLHDTMIYQRPARFPSKICYSQSFEYMFVFSKGQPKTINLIKDHKNVPDSHSGGEKINSGRDKAGNLLEKTRPIPRAFSTRWNVWKVSNGFMKSTKDIIAYDHPAIMPESLARDHILSWSKEGDLILDPFAGSGTTLKMARLRRRNFIGIEISEEYYNLIHKRLASHNNHSLEVFSE